MKNDKSQEIWGKNGVFWKKSRKVFKKHQILSVQIYQNPYIQKPLIGKKII